MIDARRMEVYMALFDSSGKRIENDTAVVIRFRYIFIGTRFAVPSFSLDQVLQNAVI